MAFDEKLANRVRLALAGSVKVQEKKMMGGLTFMVNDKMCIGILGEKIMCRINPDIYDEVLSKKGCTEMDFTGRPMKGFVFVNKDGISSEKDLEYWIKLSLEYNEIAPVSKKKKKSRDE